MVYTKNKCFFIFLLLCCLISLSTVCGEEISLTPDDSINDAIANAEDEDVIYLSEGTYKESNIYINKNIVVIGNGTPENVVIDGEYKDVIVKVRDKVTVTFLNITFLNGYKDHLGKGGAVDIRSSYVTIDNCRFINNTAGFNGGAISNAGNIGRPSILNLTNSIFIGNWVNHDGGAVSTYFSIANIKNCEFYNNSAGRDGGAIRVKFSDSHVIDNCTFMYNRAKGGDGWGAAIYTWADVNSYIKNSYIAFNYADEAGGAITSDSRLVFYNNIIVNNTAGRMGGGVYIYEEGEDLVFSVLAYNNTIYDNKILIPQYVDCGGYDVFISPRVSYGDAINFNDNYWGVNNPLNTTKYPYPWSERFETSGVAENPTTWINHYEKTQLISNNISLYYKNGTPYSVKLIDEDGSGIFNQTVTISVNGKKYSRKTNEDGFASLNINLNVGVYSITTFYNGNNYYSNASVDSTVKVLSTIIGQNIVKYFRNSTQFSTTIIDGKGNPVSDRKISLNINGVIYNRITNANGTASLNINLRPGDYTVTVLNSGDNLSRSFNIKVLSTLEGENLVKYFKNDSHYSVNVLDKQGNSLANQKVKFNINGVFYTRTSNDLGIASLNINLGPGDYIVTAIYNDLSYSNRINVLSTIESENLIMPVNNQVPFVVKVLNGTGKPFAGGKVSFNINGIIHEKISSTDGSASLNINLIAGKYIITTMFNGLSQSNTITIF